MNAPPVKAEFGLRSVRCASIPNGCGADTLSRSPLSVRLLQENGLPIAEEPLRSQGMLFGVERHRPQLPVGPVHWTDGQFGFGKCVTRVSLLSVELSDTSMFQCGVTPPWPPFECYLKAFPTGRFKFPCLSGVTRAASLSGMDATCITSDLQRIRKVTATGCAAPQFGTQLDS